MWQLAILTNLFTLLEGLPSLEKPKVPHPSMTVSPVHYPYADSQREKKSIFPLYPRFSSRENHALAYNVHLDTLGGKYELYEDESMWGWLGHSADFRYSLMTFKSDHQPFPKTLQAFIEAIEVEKDERLEFRILNSSDPEIIYALCIERICFYSKPCWENDLFAKEIKTPRFVCSIIYYTKKERFIILQREMEKPARFAEVFHLMDWQPTAEEQSFWQRMVSSVQIQNLVQ